MIIYVDIDETICETPPDRDYAKAVPIEKNINKINELYDEGNTIIFGPPGVLQLVKIGMS